LASFLLFAWRAVSRMKNGDKDTPRRGFLADDQAVNPFYPFFTIPLKIATLLLRFFLNYTIYK